MNILKSKSIIKQKDELNRSQVGVFQSSTDYAISEGKPSFFSEKEKHYAKTYEPWSSEDYLNFERESHT